MGRLTSALAVAAVASCGCVSGGSAAGESGAHVAVHVAPLSLTGIAEATYTLTVLNDSDAVVWSKQVTSTRYGDGAGSVSYVGPCDADDNPNTVQLVVDGLADAGGALTAGVDYMNPAPAGDPLEIDVLCVEGADAAADFEISFARAAQQGFFDVAVELDDVFCSAKLDCRDGADQPLLLLHDEDGARSPTAVFAFACTGGAGADTHLYLTDLTVDCGGGDVVTVDPSLGPGKLSIVPGSGLPNAHLFDALVTRGDEQLGTYAKRYWNVALGLAGVTGCDLTATGTASDAALAGNATPAGAIWPLVQWDGALATCTRHALNGADGVVSVDYTGFGGRGLAHAYPEAAAPIAEPDEDGGSPAGAGSSCAQLLADYPASVSALYWVDPDGDGGVDPFQVWCDMEHQGGGWAMYAFYEAGETVLFADPVAPTGSYGVLQDARWVALRDAMSDGMMFIENDGANERISRISAAKLRHSGDAQDCRPIGVVDTLIPGNAPLPPSGVDYDFIWWSEPGCTGGGADYSFISLGYTHGTWLYQLNGNVQFDLWPYGGYASGKLETEYYVR